MKKPDASEAEPSPVLDYRPTKADRAEERANGPASAVKGVLLFLGNMLLWIVLPSVLVVVLFFFLSILVGELLRGC